ncbi:HAD family hydrolase [Streptomyces catenulae]|uniref:HAD-IA family hydrolase n=1 Tax=Streptomyces catenulae TaxID=66875 RepID=A0ABV2YVU5_9ACTN|nr:HAD-IA family hydrolase [Streptomyces catenulae]
MTVTRGVLFDFSGTLVRSEPAESWLRGALAATGTALDESAVRDTAAALERAGALPGGAVPEAVPPELAAPWAERDHDPRRHREVYTALARRVPLPSAVLPEALYARHMRPEAWWPYPDAVEVLAELRGRGLRSGLVSNIGWDLRPVLRAHGLAPYLDCTVLSYEHRTAKPDPRLFTAACRELGLAPDEVVMVGDDRRNDGGATAVGCRYLPVDPVPVDRRPDGLRAVLDLVGRAG